MSFRIRSFDPVVPAHQNRQHPLLVLAGSTLALIAVAIGFTVSLQAQQQAGLAGAWKLEQFSGPPSGALASAQPGLLVFTKTYYSWVQVMGDKPRPALPPLGTATAAELIAVFGPSFNAQSGKYETKPDGVLVLRPVVAKSPTVMSSENAVIYTYAIQGDGLSITSTGSPTIVYKFRRQE